MKTIGKLLGKEEVNAALVLALSSAVMVLVAKGDEPPSLRQFVAGVLSNPISRGAVGAQRSSSVSAPDREVAA